MKLKNKTLLWIFLLCVLVSCMSFGITYSYLITSDELVNTLKVGETQIEVLEDYTPPEKLSPGLTFGKAPYVMNIGNLPCYVRMRADFTTIKASDFCSLSGVDEEYWAKDEEDGYYYYKYLLAPGEKTIKPLFETVKIGDCSENDLEDFDIEVYAEAVQHTDHEGEHPIDEYHTVWNSYHKNS